MADGDWRCNGKLQVCVERAIWRTGTGSSTRVRLPTDAEWLRLAGGEREGKKERYPWDVPGSGRVTDERRGRDAILARANTAESGIGGTSPVAMYPLGESKPHGLWDVAGNVWEWIDSWYDKEQRGRVLRGGSWYIIKTSPARPPRLAQSRPLGHDCRFSSGLPH